MDLTPLFKMHRKDLLRFHENGTMFKSYNDFHFKRSIIAVHSLDPVQAASSLSTQALNTSTKNAVTVKRKRVPCPVDGCFKTYQVPVKKEVLFNHIKQEHPKDVEKKED